MDLKELCKNANEAKYTVAKLDTNTKNKVLLETAARLINESKAIIEGNSRDLDRAKKNNMPQGLQDRLLLDESRIEGIAEGIRQVAALDDPIGEVTSMKKRPNGLEIGKKRVPMGLVGVIYEARPNVTADVFSLCFKTSNVCILKGGSDALESNKAIVNVIHKVLEENNIPINACTLIEDNDRATTTEFMKMKDYVDVLIPRGGAGLIRSVVENATIPVIETGTGNCHVYVDATCDVKTAVDIVENAKTQRIGVCNACESLVVHKDIMDEFLPELEKRLSGRVELRCDERSLDKINKGVKATTEDYSTEYLDYIMSIKTVDSVDEAISHINANNTGHSESIVSDNYENVQKFLNEVDAACVYANASTRFTDGFEFGFGAEIGISTQKLHARGPMGLEALTSSKYIIYGNGQIR